MAFEFKKLTLDASNVPTITTNSIGQALVDSALSPLDILTSEDNEYVSRKQAGLNTVVGVGAGMLIQSFFNLLPSFR